MNRTQIEWARNPDGSQGYTWNPITGCLNHKDGLCKGGNFPCYAYKLAHGRLKSRYLANRFGSGYFGSPFYRSTDPFYPRFWGERLEELERGIDALDYQTYIRQKPKGIFVCDMGDLFGVGIPEQWTRRILEIIGDDANSIHRFYLLTKQPQNLIKFSPFPENCWVGVTVCNDKMLDVAVDKLEDVQARVKFISFEPLLERLTLSLDYALYYSGINWLIIGACTGSASSIGALIRRYPDLVHKPLGNLWTAQPPIEWVQEIVEAADKAGIKVFLKDNLKPLLEEYPVHKANMWAHQFIEGHFELRQDMPEI